MVGSKWFGSIVLYMGWVFVWSGVSLLTHIFKHPPCVSIVFRFLWWEGVGLATRRTKHI